jgi:hypothetical protein
LYQKAGATGNVFAFTQAITVFTQVGAVLSKQLLVNLLHRFQVVAVPILLSV